MDMRIMKAKRLCWSLAMLCWSQAAFSQGTAFTYQNLLNQIGVANGGGGAGDVWMRAHGGIERVNLKGPPAAPAS
jgi:hypothetical protein